MAASRKQDERPRPPFGFAPTPRHLWLATLGLLAAAHRRLRPL